VSSQAVTASIRDELVRLDSVLTALLRAAFILPDFIILTRDKDWGGAYQVRPLWKMKSRRRAA
jgi:hypothetical protein